MKDEVFISNLLVDVYIGYRDEERRTKQPVRIDVTMETNFCELIRTLNLEHGVNYAAVRKTILVTISDKGTFTLLEELADCVVRRLFESHRIKRAKITVSKISIWRETIPGVSLERTREEYGQ